MRKTERTLILFLILICCCTGTGRAQQLSSTRIADGTSWYDIRELGLEGKGWNETKDPYDRLPGQAEGRVSEAVWKLSQHSAGLSVRFITDSPRISARWTLRNPGLALPHMPASGVSGLDLYAKIKGRWRWLGLGRPDKSPTNTQILTSNLPPGEREYMLYLPLYNGVQSVEVGIEEGTRLRKSHPQTQKPVVFYGTSIVQGASASRPGMAYPAILGRKLDYPVVNLGFSGNGKMEIEMANLLATLDPAVYVIDCLPNLEAADVLDRTQRLVQILRRAHPRTPIILVENIIYQDGMLEQLKLKRYTEKNAALRIAFRQMLKRGVRHLHYLPAKSLLGTDGEATVDGTHPNDLGFSRMAAAFEPLLCRLLGHPV